MKIPILFFVVLASVASAADTRTVFVQNIAKKELFDMLSFPGRVESTVNAQVYSESDGVVTRLLKPVGENIKRGERILVIQHLDPIYKYAPLSLTSPVDGVVSQIKVTLGSRVTKGQLLAAVTDPQAVRVVVEVAALDLPLMKKSMDGEIKIPGLEKSVPVKISRLSPFVDPATGTANCEVEIIGKSNLPPPGSVGQVSFKVNSRQGFMLPEHAISYRGEESFVNLVETGKAKRAPVTLGRRSRGQIEILSGIKDGDVVIERSSGFIGDGDEVKVEPAKAPESKPETTTTTTTTKQEAKKGG